MSADLLVALLAAGRSARFGEDKLNQSCAGRSLGRWALDAARSTGHPVVVIASRRSEWMNDARSEVVINPLASEGIGTSVALAARLAEARASKALLLMLADMPMVDDELLNQLIALGAPSACQYPSGKIGVPVFLPRSMFTEISGLSGDEGAGRHIFHIPGLQKLVPEADRLVDVDTPDDLAAVSATLVARGIAQNE